MNPNQRMLVHLLDCAINEKEPDAAYAESVEWDALFQLGQEHKIDAMLLDTLYMLPKDRQPQGAVMAAWQENAMLTMMGQAFLTEQLHEVLRALEAAGIKAVVFKGVALKILYPQPDLRTMSDADVLVAKEDIDRARAIVEERGYTLLAGEPGVFVYGGEEGLHLELHMFLFDKTTYGFLSRLEEETMFPISMARREPVYGGEGWVFPPKEHAMYMLCHMAKHMISSGFGLRQAADFVLFVRAHDKTMDWDAFWAQARLLGLDTFAGALLGIGMRFLSLPRGAWRQGVASDSPAAADALLEDLLDAGVVGHRTEERVSSAAVVYRAYETEDADSGRIRRALFPSANTLKAPYLYARAHRWLLPAAWVHRWCNYVWGLLRGTRRHRDTTAGIEIADARLQLLGALGLRDDTTKQGD